MRRLFVVVWMVGCTDGADNTLVADPPRTADRVVSFDQAAPADFGADLMPDIVLGTPEGAGANAGGLDVLSLGEGGSVVLAFDEPILDVSGPDFIVFENPFVGWIETGFVEASADGESWAQWPCDATDLGGDFEGCAGVGAVLASSDNDLDPADPDEAGGDAFDLSRVGLTEASFIRVTDSGENDYGFASGGFDLDAIVVVSPPGP